MSRTGDCPACPAHAVKLRLDGSLRSHDPGGYSTRGVERCPGSGRSPRAAPTIFHARVREIHDSDMSPIDRFVANLTASVEAHRDGGLRGRYVTHSTIEPTP